MRNNKKWERMIEYNTFFFNLENEYINHHIRNMSKWFERSYTLRSRFIVFLFSPFNVRIFHQKESSIREYRDIIDREPAASAENIGQFVITEIRLFLKKKIITTNLIWFYFISTHIKIIKLNIFLKTLVQYSIDSFGIICTDGQFIQITNTLFDIISL